ncbi:MAG: hypothetical protein WAT19_09950 [Ferruginibacter sp.]
MKKILLVLVVLFGMVSFALAQPGPGMDPEKREQKIKALYIAFITKEVKLTESEAQKFWPIHSEFDSEMMALRSEKDIIKRDEAMLNIMKKYQDRFTKVVGAERTNTFYRVDREFRKKMIEKLQQVRQQREGGNFRPRNKAAQDPNWQ